MESNFKADYSKMQDKELKKIFPSPHKGKMFLNYWLRFIRSSCENPSFGVWHLKNIEILCNLYIEYDRMTKELDDFYEVKGCYSYESHGRHGFQIKNHPIVSDRKSILGEIRNYSSLLGLSLTPVKGVSDKIDDPENEWELGK